LFRKLADRYKCAQPIGEILPNPSLSLCSKHCKDKIPKIRNKYSQKGNIGVSVPNFDIHVSVSKLFPEKEYINGIFVAVRVDS
jgi:hypothetical protein